MQYFNLDDLFHLVRLYNEDLERIISGECLSNEEILKLTKILSSLRKEIDGCNTLLYRLGSLLNYNEQLSKGFSGSDVKRWCREDDEYITLCENMTRENAIIRDYMFGYPANMINSSYTTNYLKQLESMNYLMNNCGDPREQGNYRMDNKKIELMIVDLFLKKMNLSKDKYWGYVTTGGTEGNVFGLNDGFVNYPNGYLYCFSDAHYSISKSKINQERVVMIEDNDIEKMLFSIIYNYEKYQIPAILFLTYGTTKNGKIDDIEKIKMVLDEKNIPYYLHIDAALYGAIPNNQINAPKLNVEKIKPDSLSISFHKYLGINRCNGIVLSKINKNENYIDYIGQNDTTVVGSRDFLAYSTYQQINEVLNRSSSNEYYENIAFFKEKLNENNLEYSQGDEYGNIFVIPKPSEELCIKYQLATFTENGMEYAHVIIFPAHKKEIIGNLVIDLVKEKNQNKGKVKVKGNNNE